MQGRPGPLAGLHNLKRLGIYQETQTVSTHIGNLSVNTSFRRTSPYAQLSSNLDNSKVCCCRMTNKESDQRTKTDEVAKLCDRVLCGSATKLQIAVSKCPTTVQTKPSRSGRFAGSFNDKNRSFLG